MGNPTEQNKGISRFVEFPGWVKKKGPLISLATLGVLSAADAMTEGGVSSQVNTWTGNLVSPAEPKIVGTDPQLRLLNEGLEAVVRRTLASYNEWQSYSQISLQSSLNNKQSKETNIAMEQMIRSTVLGSIGILQTAKLLDYLPDKINLDDSYYTLWINSQPYDLRNRFHLQLANTWIETKLQSVDKKMQLSNESPKTEKGGLKRNIARLEDETRLLEWLRRVNPPITFSEGSYAFFPQWEMVNTARLIKQITKEGYKIPDKINWCGTGCFGDSNVIGKAYNLINETDVQNKEGVLTLAHEIGHLISVQRDLISRFSSIRGIDGQDSAKNILQYVSAYAMKNSQEDFAETFMEYVTNGNYFRLMLEQLRINNSPAYSVLKQKYDFMKNEVFSGDEFINFAKTLDTESEKEQAFHGISLNIAEGNILVVKPQPEVLPGQSFARLAFPILVKDHFEKVTVAFNYYEKSRSYDIFINNTDLIPQVWLYPIGQDKRMSVSSSDLPLPKGTHLTVGFELPKSLEKKSLDIHVNSIGTVKVGQAREVAQDEPEKMITAEKNDEPPFSLKSTNYILIIDGPQIVKDTETGEPKTYWKIQTALLDKNNKIVDKTGWVNEEIIGPEIARGLLPSK